jgi:mRNA-degrading endonuclease RelE of RelBE toxin-antitoxin system
MKDSTVKKIEEVYDQALKELRDLKERQAKIISKHIKILEKEKIKKLQEELQK